VARYLRFASRAEHEGLHGAASLFRAVAQAEEVHAAAHARVVRQLGGNPSAPLHGSAVKSTLENLKAALAGELEEIENMYPGFIEEANDRANTAAARTFNWALEAEKSHARLFSEAIAVLETGAPGWLAKARDFYVCPACGYTTERRGAERCPTCHYPREKFDLVN
jgi:rubrerythrin